MTSQRDSSTDRPRPRTNPVPPPNTRPLRAFAFDPGLATELENYDVSEVLIRVRWEPDREVQDREKPGVFVKEEGLRRGPVGDYLEVLDIDPASDCVYEPVNLNNPYILAQNGLPPSEGNPQFHQQMVYAVAMSTIQNFERALGREIFWSDRAAHENTADPTQRLRIYPHALREENAYYDPEKKALLFGYFPARPAAAEDMMPGGTVFSCLSHDIIAHETTHAILDGLQGYFLEPSNEDVLAFHEAFADIVALLQHFSYPDVLERQIARARGDLDSETLLGQLAVQFGKAIGRRGALRDSIGGKDAATNQWRLAKPDPDAYANEREPHARGALLVATIFDVFRAIYRHRTRDLLRIATAGTGILPPGDIHPDLVHRLAMEASKAAHHLLLMCVRAIDYCPPVDITFGDYLRALITADFDLVPEDERDYRIAVIESFRGRGIYPNSVRTLSVESLLWRPAEEEGTMGAFISLLRQAFLHDNLRDIWAEIVTGTQGLSSLDPGKRRRLTRMEVQARIRQFSDGFYKELRPRTEKLGSRKKTEKESRLFGFNLNCGHERDHDFEVHQVRPVRRQGPDGRMKQDLLIQFTQRRPGYLDDQRQQAENKRYLKIGQHEKPPDQPDFWYRGGATLLLDLDTFEIRYAVAKNVMKTDRLNRQREFFSNRRGRSLRELYFGTPSPRQQLAVLHQGDE